VLTDPVLRGRVAHLVRRAGAPAPDVLHTPLLVLVSHAHHDHLDLPSLRRLPAGTPVVAPRGTAQRLRKAGLAAVHEVAVGDSLELDGVTVRAVPAVHDGRRHPFGPPMPALGYVIEGPGDAPSVYFAGDTDLFEGMAEAVGPHEVALLPVAGWGPGLGPGHLDPERAALALAELRPRLAVPIHWGTFWPAGLRAVALDGPPTEFAAAAARIAPEVTVAIVRPGESLDLRATPA
jgi:L-ascorbate metabolism protein UlaG (beta-lactamase superfamily)